jgi:hypothetical protein
MRDHTPHESVTLDEGVSFNRIHTSLTFEGDQIVRKETYDAEPLLLDAARARVQTQGERWGEMRRIGIMPMAEFAKTFGMAEQDRQKYMEKWIKQNPMLCTFDKFLR